MERKYNPLIAQGFDYVGGGGETSDSNVEYPAHLDEELSKTVTLTDEAPEVLLDTQNESVTRYIVHDKTVNAGGVVSISKEGHPASGEKTLIEFPQTNTKPTAIKLTNINGNIVHWRDYDKGCVVKVYYSTDKYGYDAGYEFDADGVLPVIKDLQLKNDILDINTAEEHMTIHLQDSVEVKRKNDTVAESGQWGFKIRGLIEILRDGVATIWNGMGQLILHATYSGTHLFFEGKKILSADKDATSLQHHRKVMCFGATLVPPEERTGYVPNDVLYAYNDSYIGTGYLVAVLADGGKPIYLCTYRPTYYSGYSDYQFYHVTSVKDHYYYEDNTVVAGGVDRQGLAQFSTLNLGEGWLLSAGIGTFGNPEKMKQPALPYGYNAEDWYMGLYDPLRRAVMTCRKDQNTEFYAHGVKYEEVVRGSRLKIYSPETEIWQLGKLQYTGNSTSFMTCQYRNKIYGSTSNNLIEFTSYNLGYYINLIYAKSPYYRAYKIELYGDSAQAIGNDSDIQVGAWQSSSPVYNMKKCDLPVETSTTPLKYPYVVAYVTSDKISIRGKSSFVIENAYLVITKL